MQKGSEIRSRRKVYLQYPGLTRKTVRSVDSILGIAPICATILETSGVFSGSHMNHQKFDLKQVDYQIILQQ